MKYISKKRTVVLFIFLLRFLETLGQLVPHTGEQILVLILGPPLSHLLAVLKCIKASAYQ